MEINKTDCLDIKRDKVNVSMTYEELINVYVALGEESKASMEDAIIEHPFLNREYREICEAEEHFMFEKIHDFLCHEGIANDKGYGD